MKFVVAFSSPKRSAKTVDTAARHARALGAEIVLFRVIPDPEKVGVVAQLISTDRPMDKAKKQVDEVVSSLKTSGLNASGFVKIGEVARSISEFVREQNADLLFIGTTDVMKKRTIFFKRDPVVHYLVDNCPVALCLVRTPEILTSMDEPDEPTGENLAIPAEAPPEVAE